MVGATKSLDTQAACRFNGSAMSTSSPCTLVTKDTIQEFDLKWPGGAKGSTHELVISRSAIYVSGQTMGYVAQFDFNGALVRHIPLLDAQGASLYPHGLLLDSQERLWVSLENVGQVVRLDDNGQIAESIDVTMHVNGSAKPINPAPHGICLGSDGETIWFTGKRTSTAGRINPDRTVEHFEINTLASMPIFFQAGLGGDVWGTELLGNSILRIAPDGRIQETAIPTANSRPIGIIPSPSGDAMWFTEEAGRKVGKVTLDGKGQASIAEFPVPLQNPNDILGSLSFDRTGALWVQVYGPMSSMGHSHTPDYLVRLAPSIQQAKPSDAIPFEVHFAQSSCSMMHRIRLDHLGNLWFTEMHTDKLGKVTLS